MKSFMPGFYHDLHMKQNMQSDVMTFGRLRHGIYHSKSGIYHLGYVPWYIPWYKQNIEMVYSLVYTQIYTLVYLCDSKSHFNR